MCDCEFLFDMAQLQFTTDPMPEGIEEKIDKDEFNEKVKKTLTYKLAEAMLTKADFLVVRNKDRTITYKIRIWVVQKEDLPPWSNDTTKQIHS